MKDKGIFRVYFGIEELVLLGIILDGIGIGYSWGKKSDASHD